MINDHHQTGWSLWPQNDQNHLQYDDDDHNDHKTILANDGDASDDHSDLVTEGALPNPQRADTDLS